jgi:8-oxo-dGTP pyrophosphatase MutT (NUDIX family)
MLDIRFGERIARDAALRVGSAAVIFDESRQRVLLTQRTDNGQWCLPGGAMDPGESVAETCVREVWEETGLRVEIVRLVGVYTSPHVISVYGDGNRVQIVGVVFECRVVSGEAGISNETLAVGYYSRDEMATLDMLPTHVKRIEDAWRGEAAARWD